MIQIEPIFQSFHAKIYHNFPYFLILQFNCEVNGVPSLETCQRLVNSSDNFIHFSSAVIRHDKPICPMCRGAIAKDKLVEPSAENEEEEEKSGEMNKQNTWSSSSKV